jgi:virginiamycin A acetyltransferase
MSEDIPFEVSKSNIAENAKIYYKAKIQDSVLKEKSVVGDLSRVVNSQLGKYVRIDRGNFILNTEIDDYSYTGSNDVIIHSKIGKYCSISWGVTIGPGEHDYTRITSHDFLYNDFCELRPNSKKLPYDRFEKKCAIGNDVWIGTNSTILRGTKIGDGAIVGANSLVNKDVPPYAIVVGSPAKIIKFRFSEQIINELLDLKWWNLPPNIIKENFDIFEDKDINKTLTLLSKIKYKS